LEVLIENFGAKLCEDLIDLLFSRVVLMSATADISRYKDYFKDLGRGERVEVLAIPSSNDKTVFQRSVSYLEQAITCTLNAFIFFSRSREVHVSIQRIFLCF
jgi:hypothetical protein